MIKTIEKIDSHKIRNLTEVEDGYKLINLNLFSCYDGLHPDSLSKLGHVIFNVIIRNKMYIKATDKRYKEEEAKRIFSTTLCQPIDLAHSIHPVKYSNGESPDNDIYNIIKRLDELEEYNIFYIWKYKQPHTYIYIMERYIDSWKYYNNKGALSIQSFRKIISRTKNLIDTMSSLETQRKRTPVKEEIEESFGFFLNKLIDKLNPKISSKITKFVVNGKDLFSYTSHLVSELKKLEHEDIIEHDPSFLSRVPVSIRKQIVKSHMPKGEKMNLEMLELIPKNPNVIKVKKSKEEKNRDIAINILKQDPKIEAEDGSFENNDPFKDPRSFTLFYRANIRMHNSKAKLYDFVSEIRYAAEIMDLLLKYDRNNKKFLKAWIRSFLTFSLTGNNMYKEDNTSLKAFATTFEKYNNTYIG